MSYLTFNNFTVDRQLFAKITSRSRPLAAANERYALLHREVDRLTLGPGRSHLYFGTGVQTPLIGQTNSSSMACSLIYAPMQTCKSDKDSQIIT